MKQPHEEDRRPPASVRASTDMEPEDTPVRVADPIAGTSSHRPNTAASGTLTRLRRRKAAARHTPIQAASCI